MVVFAAVLLLEDKVVEFAAYNDSPDSLEEGAPHGLPRHAETTKNLAEYFARRGFVQKTNRS
jgi:hypothetical protein